MPRSEDRDLRLSWSGRLSLRQRILAVNIFALAILAGSLFYLDSFRGRLTEERIARSRTEAVMIADMLGALPAAQRQSILVRLGQDSRTRLRIYGRDGRKRADSWAGARPTYELRDPAAEPWHRDVARALDNGFDAIVGARRPPIFQPPPVDRLDAWPEAVAALRQGQFVSELRRAPEGTLYISAAAPVAGAADRCCCSPSTRATSGAWSATSASPWRSSCSGR